MPVDKITGKAGRITIEGVVVSFRTWELTFTPNMQDTTASDTYDEATDTLWTTQKPGPTSAEGTIEGIVDVTALTGTIETFIVRAATGGDADAVFYLNPATPVGFGVFSFSEGVLSVDVNGEATFSATVKNQGKFTFGAPVVTP